MEGKKPQNSNTTGIIQIQRNQVIENSPKPAKIENIRE